MAGIQVVRDRSCGPLLLVRGGARADEPCARRQRLTEVRGHSGCQALELLAMRNASLAAFGALAIGIVIGAGYTRSAISPAAALPCNSSARAMIRLELLFGTARPKRPPVSDQEWATFLDAEVTPRFPAGLTVLRGPGQWRGRDGGVAKEQSRILVVWHEPSSRTDAEIEAIRSAYKQRFDQESVMRVDSASCVSF
jgi:hypothetical protein